MRVSCPACSTQYNLADAKIQGRKVRVRCKRCFSDIVVDGTTQHEAVQPGVFDDEPTQVIRNPGGFAQELLWTVNLTDTDTRELGEIEIVRGWKAGLITPDAYVWREGMRDWKALLDVPELVAALGAAGAFERTLEIPPPMPTAEAPHQPTAPTELLAAEPNQTTAYPETQAQYVPAPHQPPAPPELVAAEPSETTTGPQTPAQYVPAPDQPSAPTQPRATTTTSPKGAPRGDSASPGSTSRRGPRPRNERTEGPAENSVLFSLEALKNNTSSALKEERPSARDMLGLSGPIGRGLHGGNASIPESIPPPTAEPPTVGAPAQGPADASRTREAPVPASFAPGPVPALAPPSDFARPEAPPKRGGFNKLLLVALLLSLPAVGGFFAAESGVLSRFLKQEAPAVANSAATADDPSNTEGASTQDLAGDLHASTASIDAGKPKDASPDESEPPPPAVQPERAPTATAAVKAIGIDNTTPPPEKAAPPPRQNGSSSGTSGQTSQGSDTSPAPQRPASLPSPKAPPPKAPSPATIQPPEPEPPAPPFDTAAAKSKLSAAAANAKSCRKPGGPTGKGKVQVTFAKSGRVTSANIVGGAFGGTVVGGCVARVFRKARVPEFSGSNVTVSKSFSIPQ